MQHVSALDIARCRALAAEIDTRARETDAYALERKWVAPDGVPIHAAPVALEEITEDFLLALPERAHFFTGWPPEGPSLNRLGGTAWNTLRLVHTPLAAQVLTRWWHRFQRTPAYYAGLPLEAAKAMSKWYIRQLPPALRPAHGFDGTELDRLSLSERLLAMCRLGIFERLTATEKPTVLEIGAGYGSLARALRRAYPSLTYLIVDLPTSLTLAGCYLASRHAGHVALVSSGTRLSTGDIGLVLAPELSSVAGRRVDVAINTLSFGEMSAETVEFYAAFLRRTLSSDGCLFEQNFDNTHFGRNNFSDPTIALRRHLQERARGTGWYLRGTPRVWATS